MTTIYNSKSRGPVEIGTMNYHHLLNAKGVLERDGERQAELEAVNARIAEIDAMEAEADG